MQTLVMKFGVTSVGNAAAIRQTADIYAQQKQSTDSLTALKKVILIQAKEMDEDHSHYEKVTIELHFHNTCTRHGRVIELHSNRIVQQFIRLNAKHNLRPDHIQLIIRDLCGECIEE